MDAIEILSVRPVYSKKQLEAINARLTEENAHKDDLIAHWRTVADNGGNALSEVEKANIVLTEDNRVLREALEVVRQWDMLDAVADGPYIRGIIDTALVKGEAT